LKRMKRHRLRIIRQRELRTAFELTKARERNKTRHANWIAPFGAPASPGLRDARPAAKCGGGQDETDLALLWRRCVTHVDPGEASSLQRTIEQFESQLRPDSRRAQTLET
jgi:hypothetical protein